MVRKFKKFALSRTVVIFTMFMMLMVLASESAFASNPTIVTGSVKLAQQALTWVLLLVPVTAALMFGYHTWMKSMADGESGEVAARNKAIKRVLIYSAIAEGASGLITLFLGYYK